ncbi:hypothetical protein [Nitrospira sp. BLG_2]|uniref:hypothetical protein n=1 Tax=Nitrospira sp. BLG_2 TaxID=3397507 RepID=UPI003B9C33E7
MKFSAIIPASPFEDAPFAVVVDLCNPTSSDEVTLSLGTNPVGGVLSGTLTVAAVNGIATFDDVEIDDPGEGYTLIATAPQQRPAAGQFMPGVNGTKPCCATGGCFFQPGYYYNYPPCGTTFSHNTVVNGADHSNLNPAPVMESVESNPFTILVD